MTQLREKGINTLELDYTSEASIEEAAKTFGDRPLDVLVNCAGTVASTLLIERPG